MISQIWAVYWSATGNTKKTALAIAGRLAEELKCHLEALDFTLPADRQSPLSFHSGDLVLFAVPTYAGKVPNKILPYIQENVHGNGALAVPVVTFGNRSFDNSLAELAFWLEKNGFHPIAAGAFAGRHAFTDKLAFGRPNQEDEEEMKDFAQKAARKIKGSSQIPKAVSVPGDPDAPYYIPKRLDGQPAKFLKSRPKTDRNRCIQCGACARSCPMGAIDENNTSEVPGTCIKCQRCIRLCPKGAKYFDDEDFLSHVAMLEKNFTDRKENEIFL